jgi:hypothetical protein
MLIQATRVQALQPGQRRLQESNKLNVSPCSLELNDEPHCVKQTIARRGWLAKVAGTVRLSHLVHPSAAIVRVASKNKSEIKIHLLTSCHKARVKINSNGDIES